MRNVFIFLSNIGFLITQRHFLKVFYFDKNYSKIKPQGLKSTCECSLQI